jgi:hypothetical protein
MTIGIGAHGPNAGKAVFEGLRTAEKIGKGAIGGFAVYAALGEEGQLIRFQTQRGGSKTLIISGEDTGLDPPEEVSTAKSAALISSGPDRPEPLTQFVGADPKGGIVTGHRIPNALSVEGVPLNEQALKQLIGGSTAQEAIDTVINANLEIDAGLIAIDLQGRVYSRNSNRVSRRPDLGHARLEDPRNGAVVEVLHNAIRPFPILASVVAAVALEEMVGMPKPSGWVTVNAGTPFILGEENAVLCDHNLIATKLLTTDPVLVSGRHICVAIYIHSAVYSDGKYLGKTMFEPISVVEDGRLIEMSGQKKVKMSFME